MKICVGLSGGVDSSVAALLLKQQGYDVFGLFMQNWHDASTTLHGECEWEEDRFVAEMVARKIGIPFYFVDLSEQYRARVVDYMFDEYAKGRTPNPDVLCNREIKFAAFRETAMKLGADMVATGHYCRKDSITDTDGKVIWRILEGLDQNKDQSYFLCQLTQEQLASALFPVGDLTKPEVRKIAAEADLPSATRKDSQGICFVGKVDLPTFLKQKLTPKDGNVVEVFDSYYAQNAHYQEVSSLLDSLLSLEDCDGSMRGEHIGNDVETDNRKTGGEGENVDENHLKAKCGEADRRKAMMVTDYVGDSPVPKASNGAIAEKPLSNCPWDLAKVSALTDADLDILSEPVRYDDIHFETETYRSGRKHIRKTRYKDNPHAKIVGTHDGAQFYTIGQRKGLNIGGHKDSLFVIDTDMDSNIIYVGEGHRHPGLSRSCLKIDSSDVHWIREDMKMSPGEMHRYYLRIRYRQPLQNATVLMRDDAMYVLFDDPQRGITPGQFAVWYTDEGEMIGSGTI